LSKQSKKKNSYAVNTPTDPKRVFNEIIKSLPQEEKRGRYVLPEEAEKL
jgi:hypothetical protein